MLYTVITKPDPKKFERAVAELLNDGWSLHGTPTLSASGALVQALIKEEAKKTSGKAKQKVSE